MSYYPTTNSRFITLFDTIDQKHRSGDAEATNDIGLLITWLSRYFGFLDNDEAPVSDSVINAKNEKERRKLRLQQIESKRELREKSAANAQEKINELAAKYNTDIVFLPNDKPHILPAEMILSAEMS